MYACQPWYIYTQSSITRLHLAYNNAYRFYITPTGMQAFAHIKLLVLLRYLMPWLETICVFLLNIARLHLTFSSSHFNCPMQFRNFNLSTVTQRLCMTMSECSSYWALFQSSFHFQYRLRVPTNSYPLMRRDYAFLSWPSVSTPWCSFIWRLWFGPCV